MKILIIRNWPTYLSIRNNTYNIQEVGLARALVRTGEICDVLFWTDGEEEDVRVPAGNGRFVTVFYRHGKVILKNTIFTGCRALFEAYDVLQASEYNQMQSWLLAKAYPEKTVIYHGPYDAPFNKRYNLMCRVFDLLFLKRYIRLGTPFMTKSRLAEEFLLKKGIREACVETVGVGMDPEMLGTEEEFCEEPLIKAMRKAPDGPKFLYVGQLEPRRDSLFLMDVFAKIRQKLPGARLYIVGTGEKAYVDQVFRHAAERKIENDVVRQERMEQKYLSGVYRRADFFLFPTLYDIFGMVLLEAMYYGTAVISTENGGSVTMLSEKNGVVMKEADAERWAEAVVSLWQDRERLADMKKAAKETVRSQFTWDRLAPTFIRQYRLTAEKNGERL